MVTRGSGIRMGKFDRAVDQLLDGERALASVLLSPSRDLETDVADGHWAFATETRVVLLNGTFNPHGIHWWFWRDDLVAVYVEKRWQNSWINKAIEYIVTFELANGTTFTGCVFAAGAGKREVKRFCDALGFAHGL